MKENKLYLHLMAVLAISGALAALLPSLATATQCLVMGIAALGGTFLLGKVGLLSFAQAAFFGAGSYAAGLAGLHLNVGALGMLAAGMVAAGVVGLLVGCVATRRRGVYFIMMTLALGQLAFFIAYAWSDLTGGDNGLASVPRAPLSIAGHSLLSLESPGVFYGFCVLCLLLTYAALHCFSRSPFGAVLAAIRENEDRAIAAGYNVYWFKVGAIVASAGAAGVAGALYAMFLRFVPLSNIDFTMVNHLVLVTLIGGTGSLMGGVLGGVAYELLSHTLAEVWDRWLLLLGLALIGIGVWMQSGLWGLWEALLRRVRPGQDSKEGFDERRHA